MRGFLGTYNICGNPVGTEAAGRQDALLAAFGMRPRSVGSAADCCVVSLAEGPFAPSFACERATGPQAAVLAVFDGRLDNRQAILKQVGAGPEAAREWNSADLLLAAYRRWETDCPHYLVGDYAFTVWDPQRNRLLCARDPMQFRPIYYGCSSNQFRWASTPDLLLASGTFPTEYDLEYLCKYIVWQNLNSSRTPYASISQLPGGTAMTVTPQGTSIWQWWKLPEAGSLSYRTRGEYQERLRVLLEEAVEARLEPGAPVAITLTGGIDSGAVAATTQQLVRNGRVAAPSVQGFTWTFPNDPEADESRNAGVLARHLELAHRELSVTAPTFFRNFATASAKFPEPNLIAGFWDLWMIMASACREASAPVLLTGIGGDELFLAEPYYLAQMLREGRLGSLAHDLWVLWRSGAPLRRLFKKGLVRGLIYPAEDHGSAPRSVRSWFRGNWYEATCPTRVRQVHPRERWFHTEFTERQRHIAALSGIVLSEVGVEFRHPYLDRRLIEFAYSVPPHIRATPLDSRDKNKPLLRGAFAERIPRRVQARGVAAEPFTSRGLYEAWDAICRTLEDPPQVLREILNIETIRQELPGLRRGEHALLPLIGLALWLEGREQGTLSASLE